MLDPAARKAAGEKRMAETEKMLTEYINRKFHPEAFNQERSDGK